MKVTDIIKAVCSLSIEGKDPLNHLWVNERAIGWNLHNGFGTFTEAGLVVPVKKICGMSSKT
jgi:hypothetical protein